MKPESALTAAAAAQVAHHQLMTSHHKLSEVKSSDKSSVKAEPLEQMSLYSSHFATAKPPHPLTGMTQHDPSMLTGLPHLTPAPYSTPHQGFSLEDYKYPSTHSHQPDYSSLSSTSMPSSGVFAYPGLTNPEHSTHHHHHHHHHHKLNQLNLQTS